MNGNVKEEESHVANHPSEWVLIYIDLKGMAGKESGAQQLSMRYHRSKDWDVLRLRGTELQPLSKRDFYHGRWSRDFWDSWKKPFSFLPFEKGSGEKGWPGGVRSCWFVGMPIDNQQQSQSTADSETIIQQAAPMWGWVLKKLLMRAQWKPKWWMYLASLFSFLPQAAGFANEPWKNTCGHVFTLMGLHQTALDGTFLVLQSVP